MEKNLLNKKLDEKMKKHPYLKEIIAFNTQYSMMSPYADTTVIASPELMLRGYLFSKYNRFLSEEYLLNYRTDNRSIGFEMGIGRFQASDAVQTAAHRNLKEEKEEIIKLPKHKNIRTPLGSVISSRRSVREYSGRTMPLEDLSTILYYAQGISGKLYLEGETYDTDCIKLRNAPSGGGLYPINLYVIAWNIKNIDKGIYIYYPYSHSLKPMKKSITIDEYSKLAGFGDIQVERPNFSVIYVYDFIVNSRKYGNSAMAYAFIEAGEISENIQLTSTAMGYGATDIGGTEKQKIEKLLEIDGFLRHAILFTIVGEGVNII
ncbi:SagB/ThcOx family dehydrogenase [Aceticella autotrophica]|uniref:SagB/ThcOx family dehydrogenase n=1 Tax=Aceticella autotrophica TaxID=2755338 RepID=A0A975AVJ1_9THEO|nr:SagB/ThcOx family dehydrogenase [Aceticella autotrophica]QSZ27193.1 SagB/ThcOx family dehydrogenase [Aceticella autotrophica]